MLLCGGVRSDGLRTAVDRIASDGLGAIELTDGRGVTLLRVASQRAAVRAVRWGTDDHFPTLRERADWLDPTLGDPDLKAYPGGWGR